MQHGNACNLRTSAVLLTSFLVLGPGPAQALEGPAEPSAPHEALTFFEGSWTTADSRPEESFRETCTWLAEGRRHMMCRSRWQSQAGMREGLSIFSFDSASGEYLYHGFRSGGAVVTLRGRSTPTGWIFASEGGSGPDRLRTRVTIERNSDGGFTLTSATATGDDPWSTSQPVVYLRMTQ